MRATRTAAFGAGGRGTVSQPIPRLQPLLLFGLLLLLALPACGSSSVTPDLPAPPSTPPPGGFVVTVTPDGVVPQVLHVWEGRKAAFVNNDSRAHALFADPHPAHSGCSGFLNVGTLGPGERREVANLPIDACFYHDEGDPANQAFQGLVLVH